MALSTSRKVVATAALALAALLALGHIAASRVWQQQRAVPGLLLVIAVVAATSAVLLISARSVHEDLSARERAEVALRSSEARVAGILSIAADAIISVDVDQRIVMFNRGAEEIFGYRADEMLGQSLGELLPERFRGQHGRLISEFATARENARRMAERREIFGRRKNGEEFPAEASILKLELDGQMHFTVVLRDVTERKRADERQKILAEAGAVLTSTLEVQETVASVAQLPVPRLGEACLVDLVDGAQMRRVASVSDDPALNTRLDALAAEVPGPDSPFPVVDVMRTGKAILVDAVDDEWLEAHAETERELARWRALAPRSLMIVPLVARGEALGALTVICTKRDKSCGPADLAVAEALASRAAFAIDNARLFATARAATRARDEMLGVVSHDLRNPVNAIGMCVRVLRESPPDDPEARRDLVAAIADAVEWMDRLIRDLLDVANIEAGKLSIERHREEVRPIVDSAVAMFARSAEARGVRLTHEVAPSLPAVEGDAARLVQVLSNLISNALAHTFAGGVVSVGAEARDGTVTFVVRDTGTGIEPDELPRIFERHYRSHASARRGGSGLGLAIARGIVIAHGGQIWAESTPGKGSAFYASVPVESEPG